MDPMQNGEMSVSEVLDQVQSHVPACIPVIERARHAIACSTANRPDVPICNILKKELADVNTLASDSFDCAVAVAQLYVKMQEENQQNQK